MEGSFSDIADTLIGVTLTLVLIVGVPANIVAFIYFSKQRNANPVQVNYTYVRVFIVFIVGSCFCKTALCFVLTFCFKMIKKHKNEVRICQA